MSKARSDASVTVAVTAAESARVYDIITIMKAAVNGGADVIVITSETETASVAADGALIEAKAASYKMEDAAAKLVRQMLLCLEQACSRTCSSSRGCSYLRAAGYMLSSWVVGVQDVAVGALCF